jgi:hypothetical protein
MDTKIKKWHKYVMIAGIVLGIACKLVPPTYQSPCETIAKICSGGLLP